MSLNKPARRNSADRINVITRSRRGQVHGRLLAAGHSVTQVLCESIEPRMMLTSTVTSKVPASTTPSTIAPSILSPGVNSFALTSASQSTAAISAFRFVLNNAAAGELTTFTTALTSGSTNSDAAIALYDPSGNQIKLQDGDSPSRTDETLSVALQSGVPYTVEFVGIETPSGTSTQLALKIDTGLQANSNTIALNPANGTGSLTTDTPPNSFLSSNSVRYFPLTFTNAGSTASVSISAGGPDSAVATSLYIANAGSNSWTKISSASLSLGGAPVSLAVTPPPAGGNITDGKYLLAIEPLNLTAAPEPVTVSLSTPSLLVPATINPAGSTGTVTQAINGAGSLIGTTASTFAAGASSLVSVVAATSGPMTISALATTNFVPLLGVYDSTGSTILAVNTGTVPFSSAVATINAVAGQTYYFRAGMAFGSQSGSISLTASQAYTATDIAVGTTLGQQTNLSIAPSSGSRVFHLTTSGTKFLALQLAPDAGSTLRPQVTVLNASGVAQTFTAPAGGQAVTVVLDQSTSSGPYDLQVSGISGAGTATLNYVALVLPTSIAVNQFTQSTLANTTGTLNSNVFSTTTGTPIGIQYFQPNNPTGAINTNYSAISTNGGAAVLLHYVQEGNTFKLVDTSAPGSSNTATLSEQVRGQTLHALVALPINFSGTGTVQLSVSGPLPVGIAVPFTPNVVPGAPAPPAGFQALLNVSGAKLATNIQRDLYNTLIPYNISNSSATLVFTPKDLGGPLAVTVSVLNGVNAIIASGTSTAGQPISIPITGLTAAQQLRFEVKAVNASNVGTGGYSVSLAVNTTDSGPFLVTEPAFLPFVPAGFQDPLKSYLPNGLGFNTINFGSSGVGNFTSSQPYNRAGTGSIQMFKLTGATTNVPYQVTATDITSGVNVNFALYRFDSASNSYISLNGSGPSFDYYPGDRTTLDARIVVNNTDLDPIYANGEVGGGPIDLYAIVKNEQGTRGQYSIKFEAAPVPTAATGANVLLVTAASGSQYLADSQLVTQTVNSTRFTLHTPSDMATGGTPTITINTINHSVGAQITVSIGKGFVGVGTYTGTVAGNGTVTIPLVGGIQNLSRNNTYDVTVTSSAFPSSGMTLSVTVPRVTGTAPLPPNLPSSVPDQFTYNATYGRLNVLPNGTINQLRVTPGGTLSTVFNVERAGVITLHVAYPAGTTNVALGLYQSGLTFNSSTGAYTSAGILLDYSNVADANGLYSITAAVAPGTYFLRGTGTIPNGSFTFVTVTGILPAEQANPLFVEPSTGATAVAEETIVNQGQTVITTPNSHPFATTHFTGSLFSVTVPANTNGQPISFSIYDKYDNSAGNGIGIANVFIWRFANNNYTQVGSASNALSSSTHSSLITSIDTPVPGAQYFIGVEFDGYQTAAYVAVNIPIFTSGVADFSVAPITLTANAGSTLVQSGISNSSFTASQPANYTLKLGSTTSTRAIPTLIPFGRLGIFQTWAPGSASDVVTITANPTGAIAEVSTTNNTQSLALSTVDANAPTAVISLADTAMTGEGNANASTGGGTWGRYIAGVTGQSTTIRVVGHDSDSDLYQITASVRNGNGTYSLDNLKVFYTLGTADFTSSIPFDFGTLLATTTTNLNQLQFFSMDVFGLRTPIYIQKLDVAPAPSFLSGGIPADGVSGAGGTIKFNASTHQFTYNFQDSIISLSNTLSDLLGVSVPVIGEKKNKFLVAITGTGTGGLAPLDVPLSLSGHAQLVALDDNIFDKTYSGTQTVGDNITFKSLMTLNGKSLVPGSASVSMQVTNLQLLDLKSPLIPIFSIGVPGVAEVKAGVKFALNAKLNAAVKVGLDPTATNIAGYLGSIGVMSPTFVQPIITGTATVEGDVSVLGFDIASLSGSVGLTLTITLGLDNNLGNAIIPFSQAPSDISLAVDAKINIHLAAHVAILGDIYTYDYDHDYGNIINTIHNGIFLTDPPSNAPGKFVSPPGAQGARRRRRGNSDDAPAPIIKGGSSTLGAYKIDPSPQLVISNTNPDGTTLLNGTGLSIQLVNAGTTAAPLANLSFATRTGGAWSGATTLAQANDVSDPQLALSHDATGSPGVVVYDVDNVAGSPTSQTFNQRLTSQDIRYRYYNGTTWGAEQSLTSDGLYDSQQSLAFGSTGEGALAFVHNINAAPISAGGALDSASNEIYASVWNKASHTWGAPVAITSGGGSDSSPSTYVDSTGKRYITWIRSSAGASQLMYSTNTGAGWSTAAVLNSGGLQAGGTFKNVAIGSDGNGRVDVLFAYEIPNADGSITTALYQRLSLSGSFASSSPATQIAANSTYSGLRVTNSATGALVGYWQQSDGQSNQLYGVTITGGVANSPTQLTASQDVANNASAAVDGNGTLQVIYDNSVVYGGTAHSAPTDPTVGAPVTAGVASSSAQMLPQFSFSKGLAFPVESSSAAIGSAITGAAVVTNRGLASGTVTITAYNGVPGTGTVVGSRTITLAPGATYDFSQVFNVAAGTQNYSFQLSTASQQAFSATGESISTVAFTGLAELTAISLTNTNFAPAAGSAQTLRATVKNLSTVSSGSVVVRLYAGDPRSPQVAPVAVGTQTVTLAGGAQTTLLFNITLPAGAGDYIYTVVVDPDEQIAESNENNNDQRYEVDLRADPSISSDNGVPVTATLLNNSTSNNVQVDASVSNFSPTPMTNVPVNLSVSRNGGPFVNIGQMIVASLPVGSTSLLSFVITARAGNNVFAASIDPSVFAQDSNLSNNTGSTSLYISGTSTLSATASLSAGVSRAGSPLSLTANLVNTGLADADNVPLIVVATPQAGGAGIVIGTGSYSIAGLTSGSTVIALDTSRLARGIYTFTLQVDPDGTVLQDTVVSNTVALTEIISTPLQLTATSANEYVQLDSDGIHLDIWDRLTPSGSPDQQYLLSTVSDFSTGFGNIGNLTVDFANGSPIPAGGFLFNAAGPNSNLTIVGTPGADAFNLGAVKVGLVSGAISGLVNYGNLGSLTLNGGTGADVINLDSTSGDPLPANLHLNGTFTLNGFSSFANKTVDLGRSTVFLTYAAGFDPVTAIRQYLTRGSNNGSWNGVGLAGLGAINSSAAALGTTSAIGYADSADGTGVNTRPNSIELKYTQKADANLDNLVNFSDLLVLSQNFNQPGRGWDQGDFNYDGTVSFSDLLTLAQEFNLPLSSFFASNGDPIKHHGKHAGGIDALLEEVKKEEGLVQ